MLLAGRARLDGRSMLLVKMTDISESVISSMTNIGESVISGELWCNILSDYYVQLIVHFFKSLLCR